MTYIRNRSACEDIVLYSNVHDDSVEYGFLRVYLVTLGDVTEAEEPDSSDEESTSPYCSNFFTSLMMRNTTNRSNATGQSVRNWQRRQSTFGHNTKGGIQDPTITIVSRIRMHVPN